MKTLIHDFKCLYGSHPMVLRAQWNDLLKSDDAKVQLNNYDKSEVGFHMYMVAQNFLWTYPKNHEVLSSHFAFLSSRSAYGAPLWKWVGRIAALRAKKIIWPESSFNDPNAEIFIIGVDGVDFKVWEKKHPLVNKDSKMCSHKFKSAGVKYEIGVSSYDSKCVWISGPFRCGKHDATIYQGKEDLADYAFRRRLGLPVHECLEEKMPAGKLAVADSIYSKGKHTAVPNPCDSKMLHNHKARIRCRQESFNGRLKNYAILSQCFRHDLKKHKVALEAIAVTIQYQMDLGDELFQVI